MPTIPPTSSFVSGRTKPAARKSATSPSTLPDQIKTDAVIAHESGGSGENLAAIIASRIAHARSGASEIEVCSSAQSLEQFARGQGVWHKLHLRDRRRQLQQMSDLLDELYPNYRWFLFDARTCFSAPYTVFGLKRAAVYMGSMYFVFTSTSHIRAYSPATLTT